MLWKQAVLLAMVSGVTGSLAVLPTPEPLRPCDVASAWVQQHRDALPTRLAEFERFDRAHRKAIFGTLPAATKLSLWTERFDQFAMQDGLSAAQRHYLADAPRVLGEVLRASPDGVVRGSRADSLVQTLGRQARELFGERTARQLVSLFGPSPTISLVPTDDIPEDCDCDTWNTNVEDDCPASDGYCRAGSVTKPCNYSSFGCGDFGFYSCDGLCVPAN